MVGIWKDAKHHIDDSLEAHETIHGDCDFMVILYVLSVHIYVKWHFPWEVHQRGLNIDGAKCICKVVSGDASKIIPSMVNMWHYKIKENWMKMSQNMSI
jgi:hypothetical protein